MGHYSALQKLHVYNYRTFEVNHLMKRLFTMSIIGVLLFTLSCNKHSDLQDANKVIAIQPLNNCDKKDIGHLISDLETFFNKEVVVLPASKIPEPFANYQKGKRYDAGRIINWLTSLANDSIITVVGITSEADIYTAKKDKQGNIRKPESTYAVWGIFGLGYCPGKSCVISATRLFTADEQKFRHRLRTVTIHEIGHNLGLPHCPNKGCIMSDANEKIATVDQSGDNYCSDCNRKIGRTEAKL
ncbi:MAG: matrixin family metalloprotease [Taibaiella sp.]